MLTHIHLRDFVIVDHLELDFDSGMTALTGETGAGKSILIDALGLAFGDRAGQDVIRHGADRTEISVGFDLRDHPPVRDWLVRQELAAENDCLLRRVINRNGRSRSYINGHPVPLQQLRELGEQLVDIHGQHEHQSLIHRSVQRRILDGFAGLLEDCAELADRFDTWKQQRQQYETLRQAGRERSDRIDLLRFHVQELQTLDLAAEDVEHLEADYQRLAHAGDLISHCQQAYEALYDGEQAAHQIISQQMQALRGLTQADRRLENTCELLEAAAIQIQEAADELRHCNAELDTDPERLRELENRIALLHQLARKHRVRPEQLPAVLADAQQELEQLDHADQHLEQLEHSITASADAYRQLAGRLHQARTRAAKTLSGTITEAMQTLGMPGGRCDIRVTQTPDETFSRHGLDTVEFLVSANPGQPPAALKKIASGGELSRISLAIQVISSELNSVPSMIFDEVDSGIGGATAEVVGQKLRLLGERHQVFCVTHLPQVAAQAHQHFQVSKLQGEDVTRSRIRPLAPAERIEEIARMLGGVDITEATLAHAREMIEAPTKKTNRKGQGTSD